MNLNPLFPTTDTLAINTDLYELTMAAAYFAAGRSADRATFELFARKLPPNRGFLVAAGLEQALHYICNVRFSEEALAFLQRQQVFRHVPPDFFDYLREFRFTGEVSALPEGTVFFANEPILQVSGPVIEAQLLETYLINVVNFQSMVASKAARLSLAARGARVIDFGSRRAHSPQAGVMAARASFIGGCHGTSNVLAGFEMGIPIYGTMAHSFVQFFGDEREAFRCFQQFFPDDSILLVDTYDTLEGVQRAIEMPGEIQGIRLDSGDLASLALSSRRLLDDGGRGDVKIVASGDLDEEKIRAFCLKEIPVDAYGVGTDLVVSADAPSCDLVYKLVEVNQDGRVEPRIKTSPGKVILPFRKQIYRKIDDGFFSGDILSRWDEPEPAPGDGFETLLEPVVQAGELLRELPDLFAIQEAARQQIGKLPASMKLLHSSEEYPVQYSKILVESQKALARGSE